MPCRHAAGAVYNAAASGKTGTADNKENATRVLPSERLFRFGHPVARGRLRLLDTPIDQRTQGRSLMIVYDDTLVNSAAHSASMNLTVTSIETTNQDATRSEPYHCDSTRAD
jgi:hypothetical protein